MLVGDETRFVVRGRGRGSGRGRCLMSCFWIVRKVGFDQRQTDGHTSIDECFLINTSRPTTDTYGSSRKAMRR